MTSAETQVTTQVPTAVVRRRPRISLAPASPPAVGVWPTSREWLLQLMACSILVLNLLDGVFTLIWVRYGQADEANPVMASFLRESPIAFLVAKLSLVAAGVLFLWRHRARRLAASGIVIAFVVYAAVMADHVSHVRLMAEALR